MSIKPIIPQGAPPPLAPYSPGTLAGNVIYVAGTLAIGADGKLVGPGDVRAQTRHVLEQVKSVIETGGGTLRDVAYVQIFLANLDDYAAMNEVYRQFFPADPPARFTIRADLVKPEFLVEIAAIAHPQ
jgi:aminoacrylate peracid reductase